MDRLLFTNIRRRTDTYPVDLLIDGGVFAEIAPSLAQAYPQVPCIDLGGRLVLPPYVEPHIHLDYVYTAREPGAPGAGGTLFEGISRWSRTKAGMSAQEMKRRARIAVKKQVLSGVQHIRTHVDVTDPALMGLRAMLELREELRDFVSIQIVAFPQEGMYAYPGGDRLVQEALEMGADAVGAIPHYEFTRGLGIRSVRRAVRLAVKYGCMVDVHCDETDDEQSRFLEELASQAYLHDVGELTTASHTCAMGSYNNAYTARLFGLLERAGIHFAVCPTENLHLQGRGDAYPRRRGVTRVPELLAAGLNVCFAQDSISDPWYPLGSGNLMNVLDAGLHVCQLTKSEQIEHALDLITDNGAKALRLGNGYGIAPGRPASFIALNADNPFDAVCERAPVACSVRSGRILFIRNEQIHTQEPFLTGGELSMIQKIGGQQAVEQFVADKRVV